MTGEKKSPELNHFQEKNKLVRTVCCVSYYISHDIIQIGHNQYEANRKMSRVDIFMDQEEDTEDKNDKKEDGKIGPDALVDVLA